MKNSDNKSTATSSRPASPKENVKPSNLKVHFTVEGLKLNELESLDSRTKFKQAMLREI